MTNDIIIAQALEAELRSDLQAYDKLPQCKVPHRLDRRISALIRKNSPVNTAVHRKPVPLKRRLLIAAIIVIIMAVLTGGITVITRNLGLFTVKQYDIFSMLAIEDNDSETPVLTEKYRIITDGSQFTGKVIDDYEFMHTESYSDQANGKQLYFTQSIKDMYKSVRLITENAITYPELIKIGNNINAVYFESSNHNILLIWEAGNSIIELNATGFSKDELIELSKFVQKVE